MLPGKRSLRGGGLSFPAPEITGAEKGQFAERRRSFPWVRLSQKHKGSRKIKTDKDYLTFLNKKRPLKQLTKSRKFGIITFVLYGS